VIFAMMQAWSRSSSNLLSNNPISVKII